MSCSYDVIGWGLRCAPAGAVLAPGGLRVLFIERKLAGKPATALWPERVVAQV